MEQADGDGIALLEHDVGLHEPAEEPLALASLADPLQVGPDPRATVALTDPVADRTPRAEEGLTLRKIGQAHRGLVVPSSADALVLEVPEPAADLGGEHVGVVEGRAPEPLPGPGIPDDHVDVVVLQVLRVVEVQAEPSAQRQDVLLVAREEVPAILAAEALAIVGEHLGRVPTGIDRDGVHVDVLPHAVTQDLLDLAEARRLHGAHVRTGGVHEVEDDGSSLDQVLLEANLGPVVTDELDVGEGGRRPEARAGREILDRSLGREGGDREEEGRESNHGGRVGEGGER